ncbi:MAG: (d)CMP kinase [Tissierellia bacterium]|nr:(d)CMP kinase [Tissierellia bacterium]
MNRKELLDRVNKKNISRILIAHPLGEILREEDFDIDFQEFITTVSKDGEYHYFPLDREFNIAIDGPSGSGKSTIAKKIAKQLNIAYLDTGAMYRGITYALMEKKIDLHNEGAIKVALEEMSFQYDHGKLLLNGEDLEDRIRSKEVTDQVSLVSSYGFVREKLVDTQREISKKQSTVLDGRDIGTVVLPQAKVKIYLTATPEVRAKRRFKQMNEAIAFEMVLSDINRRDEYDTTREISPLKKAEDGIRLDNSNMDEGETIQKVMEIILKKAGE